MHYDLVLCDIGGVAIDFDADRLVHQAAQLLSRPFEEVQRAVYHPELLLPFELGRISPAAYYEGLRGQLKLTWTYEQFVRIWNDIFTENRDVTWILERLKARHRLTALSNTNLLHYQHLRATIPSLTVFSDWVVSCEVGLRKPDPKIYFLALERAKVFPRQAVYIDDRPELVDAARSLGINGIRFEHSRQLEQDLQSIGLNL